MFKADHLELDNLSGGSSPSLCRHLLPTALHLGVGPSEMSPVRICMLAGSRFPGPLARMNQSHFKDRDNSQKSSV